MQQSPMRFPAEWEPQSAVLLAWPHAGTDWADRLAEVEDTYIALVAAITRFQKVVICVADDDIETYARARLSSARINMDRVVFTTVAYDDTWLRDSGPITLVQDAALEDAEPGPVSNSPSPRSQGEGAQRADEGRSCEDAATAAPLTLLRSAKLSRAPRPGRCVSRNDVRSCADQWSASNTPAPPQAGRGEVVASENTARQFQLLDFRFTAWGGKFEASQDDQLVTRLDESGIFLNTTRQSIDFAMEGGAMETDGAGTLLTTWQCLQERHPDVSRDALSERLGAWLRQDRVLWLEHGALEGDDTDAHIDTLARFASTDAIVYQACDDPDDGHYAGLQAMAAEIGALLTVSGEPYRLFPLPWPRAIMDDGRRLAASYANFLVINDAVLMPAYGDPADVAAQGVLADAFPGREVIPVPCRSLIWQNGSLHCITMQLPSGLLA